MIFRPSLESDKGRVGDAFPRDCGDNRTGGNRSHRVTCDSTLHSVYLLVVLWMLTRASHSGRGAWGLKPVGGVSKLEICIDTI